MQDKLKQLKTILAEVSHLHKVIHILSWDQQVYMPPGGAESRSEQLETLERIKHDRFTSEETGKLLQALKPYTATLEPDSDDARLIMMIGRRYEKRTKVPSEFVGELARVTALAYQVWTRARAEDNFALFQPHLEKIFDMKRQYASFFAPYDHIYDPLLDEYQPGMKTAEVQAIFTPLRTQQVELIKAISGKPQVDDSFLYQDFDEARQWDFGVQVITKFGYDWEQGRQDKTVHPFTIDVGYGDIRITTRIDPKFFNTAFFSTVHECGHALYDQGIPKPLKDVTLDDEALALGIHESQSRMWENLVGRSVPFWRYFYPKLQKTFPTQLGQVKLEDFYKGINKVQPSFVRVEADEATYNLHIMLRLEIEIGLMEGNLQVKDLPEIWNDRMQAYLGIIPPNDAEGVLQDVHWADGYVGYFSTYALGNLIAAQLWEKVKQDIPDLEDQITRGEFSALLGWGREKIHKHGAKFFPQELVQRITGSKIEAAPYIRYLQNKFGQIYNLS
jgi:carboxypeptidase Taq